MKCLRSATRNSRKRCFEKMREVGRSGRTILFVSHNMSAVRNICQHGFVLDHGMIVERGEINNVVDKYLSRLSEEREVDSRLKRKAFWSKMLNSIQIRDLLSKL